ncbi:MAG: hypothetical protein LBP53_04150 [Candidatus Peribacteria bacterium]|jgi:retron-type reverse transcriptase|nr:hypothetical protein [Candidatus Peribacteria bacterium]
MSLVCDIFKSYYDARINKRNTISQLEFEFDLERNLLHLYQELQNNRYEIGPSIFFIQTHPVKREIFAGAFRDRIVHHLIYNYLNPLCEKTFIYDSYSCRVDKGTSKGVQRMSTFIRSCSQNYTKDCYILKLDIQGYFMSIHKDILYHSIQSLIDQKISLLKIPMTTEWLLQLIHKVIYHDCTQNGIFKGKKTDYE